MDDREFLTTTAIRDKEDIYDAIKAFLGKGQLTPEQERIRELERELAVVQQERDILKKAIAIFSETQK